MKKCTDKMRNADESNLMAGDCNCNHGQTSGLSSLELSSTRSSTSVAAVLWSSCEVEAI